MSCEPKAEKTGQVTIISVPFFIYYWFIDTWDYQLPRDTECWMMWAV